jgi:hypothetical protein
MTQPRVRISTLMLLVAIVAGGLAGYRYYARFVRRSTVIYSVAAHVLPTFGRTRDIDYQPLLNSLQSEVMPGSWKNRGGSATAEPIYLTLSLRVEQSEAGQERVVEFLRGLGTPTSSTPPPVSADGNHAQRHR